jgi:acyl carrier protein
MDWRVLSRFLPSASDPKFSDIRLPAAVGGDDLSSVEDIERMLATMDDQELSVAFIEILRSEIGEILRLAPDRIDPERSVYEIGLDSLMGVELVTAIEARFGIRLPVMALSETPTIARLAEKVIARLRDTRDGTAPAGDKVAQQVQQAVMQHAPNVGNQTVEQLVVEMSRVSAAHSGKMIH